ncbi:MAG: ClpX C4-type zinc finger protein, partial [Eubacteriales bacterium]
MQDNEILDSEIDEVEKEDSTPTKEEEELEKEYEDVCYICRRPESKAGKMFRLLTEVTICNDCMHKAMESLNGYDVDTLIDRFGKKPSKKPTKKTSKKTKDIETPKEIEPLKEEEVEEGVREP